MTRVYLSLGSNEGDTLSNIIEAIGEVLALEGVKPAGAGGFYETEPQGGVDQEWFLNTAVAIETDRTPDDLLTELKAIEERMGRDPAAERWGPRIIDIDILFYGGETVASDRLTIPHPEVHRRRFALRPVADIDAGFIHPGLGLSVGDLLSGLPETGQAMRKASP